MTVKVPLTRGKFAIVDDADAELVSKYRWFCLNVGYAARQVRIDGKEVTQMMHRLLLGAADDQLVDHINHDTLDNRRANLRLCTRTDNQRNQKRNSKNTTGHKGVSYDKRRNKFTASIHISGKQIHLGRFASVEDAAKAYEDAAARHFGEFSYSHSVAAAPSVSVVDDMAVTGRPTYSSRYRGVSWRKRAGMWVANIGVNGKIVHLGLFAVERDAAAAYNQAAIKYYGDNAKLNQLGE